MINSDICPQNVFFKFISLNENKTLSFFNLQFEQQEKTFYPEDGKKNKHDQSIPGTWIGLIFNFFYF